ncbi:hypothetical protein Hte_004389 [Hypoxylon texense]
MTPTSTTSSKSQARRKVSCPGYFENALVPLGAYNHCTTPDDFQGVPARIQTLVLELQTFDKSTIKADDLDRLKTRQRLLFWDLEKLSGRIQKTDTQKLLMKELGFELPQYSDSDFERRVRGYQTQATGALPLLEGPQQQEEGLQIAAVHEPDDGEFSDADEAYEALEAYSRQLTTLNNLPIVQNDSADFHGHAIPDDYDDSVSERDRIIQPRPDAAFGYKEESFRRIDELRRWMTTTHTEEGKSKITINKSSQVFSYAFVEVKSALGNVEVAGLNQLFSDAIAALKFNSRVLRNRVNILFGILLCSQRIRVYTFWKTMERLNIKNIQNYDISKFGDFLACRAFADKLHQWGVNEHFQAISGEIDHKIDTPSQ